MKPELFLLNWIPEGTKKKNQRHIIIYVITAARILLASYWKTLSIPTEDELVMKITETVEMNKWTSILKGQMEEDVTEIWTPFYVDKKSV